MHLSRKWSINDEWCAASEQGRNTTRPGSNGTFGGNQALHCHMPLQLFALRLRPCASKWCFSSTTAKESTLSWLSCPVATALLWQLQSIFLEAWFVLKTSSPLRVSLTETCHYPLVRAAQFKVNSPDCPDCSLSAKAYLAVCSTDRKSNIGSYHNCERRSQLNSESTAGSIRKHFTITLCISSDWYHAVCQSLTRFFFNRLSPTDFCHRNKVKRARNCWIMETVQASHLQ